MEFLSLKNTTMLKSLNTQTDFSGIIYIVYSAHGPS